MFDIVTQKFPNETIHGFIEKLIEIKKKKNQIEKIREKRTFKIEKFIPLLFHHVNTEFL